jgi:hypothetical protein
VYATQLLDHAQVVDCVMQVIDRNHDAALSAIELDFALHKYTTSTERMLSHLEADAVVRQCDFDHDGRVSLEDLTLNRQSHGCLSASQHEALVRYVCNRALHHNAAYQSYFEYTLSLPDRVGVESIADILADGAAMSDKQFAVVDPTRTHIRIELPNKENGDLLGARLDNRLLLIGFICVFVVMIAAAIASFV